jgi:hypothetical protein
MPVGVKLNIEAHRLKNIKVHLARYAISKKPIMKLCLAATSLL